MLVWCLVTLLMCQAADRAKSAQPSVTKCPDSGSLPPVRAREELFAAVGIQPHLDRIRADHMDRDVLYLRAKVRSAETLVSLYPWLSLQQASRLRSAIELQDAKQCS
jgi:hypothetical protein